MSKTWDDVDNNESILANCPFCGGEPKESEDNEIEIEIQCQKCSVSMYRHNGDGDDYIVRCKQAWNKRSTQ